MAGVVNAGIDAAQTPEGAAGGVQSDRAEYSSYVLAAQEAGKKPLDFAAWVAAGKPKA